FKFPLFCKVGKKKHHFNINNYRNAHFIVNNKMKKIYHDWVYAQVLEMRLKPITSKISLELTLYRSDKRKIDKGNVLSIHLKYMLDGLVNCGVIPDDNDKIVFEERFMPTVWGVDVGYVEVVLTVLD
ncbi:MAG: hypothetical protein ACJA0H_000422, partial [Francisellaceae bacterium]